MNFPVFCGKMQMTIDFGEIHMYFNPFLIRSSDGSRVAARIDPAIEDDIVKTKEKSMWQTAWDSSYLNTPDVKKFSLKTEDDELIALGACQVFSSHAYVYILYLESAPHSNPTITTRKTRKYYGIGEVMIAFGIKYSIDNGCRGVIVFDAKTDALAKHYEEDFHALPLPNASSSGPKRFMLADEEAWNLFSKYLSEEEPI